RWRASTSPTQRPSRSTPWRHGASERAGRGQAKGPPRRSAGGPFTTLATTRAASLPSQLTASFNPLPALNFGWVDALIVIGWPVRGLRPVEALRLATEKVPKPTRRTSSPFDSAPVMVSKTPSTALVASLRERPLVSTTAPINSFLFMSGRTPLIY